MKITRLLSSPKTFSTVAASIGVATVVSSLAPASAMSGPVTLDFGCNSASQGALGCTAGASQFSAVVSPVGSNQALFSFFNIGGAAGSSITKIDLLDKGQFSLGNLVSITGSPATGVKFNSTISSTSAGNSYSFASRGSKPSLRRTNGINPGENLAVLFDIAPAGFNKPFNAVVTDLYKKGLSVELTSTGFPGASSSSVVFNSKVRAVPEPLTMLGSGAALGFGALMKRRSSKLKAKKGSNMPVEPTLETVA
jgi:hypothetical protein